MAKTTIEVQSGMADIDRTELKDIDDLMPAMDETVSDKISDFVDKSNHQPYAHTNEGYVVVVKMAGEVDATDAITEYLRKRTELMY